MENSYYSHARSANERLSILIRIFLYYYIENGENRFECSKNEEDFQPKDGEQNRNGKEEENSTFSLNYFILNNDETKAIFIIFFLFISFPVK